MKVLITGAAGNLGSHVVKELHSKGYDVLGSDRSLPREKLGDFKVVNLMDREMVYQLVEGCEAIVHLGNYSNPHRADAQTVYGHNCMMNINVFQAAMEHGVKTIIYASSIQVISGIAKGGGELACPYLPVDMDYPPAAYNSYSQSKLAGEHLLKQYVARDGISCYALRFPALTNRSVYSDMRDRVMTKHQQPNFLPLLDRMLYLPMVEAAEVIRACLETSAPGYHCYLPARPEALVDFMTPQEIIGKYYPDAVLKKPLEEIDSLIDLSQLTAETGWTPQELNEDTPEPVRAG